MYEVSAANESAANDLQNQGSHRGHGQKKLRGVDLFAGAGGFSLAARRAGIDIVAAVELNAHACMTYRTNIVENDCPKLYEDNILDLEPKNLMNDCFGDGGECDVLLGGPPCQGFSVHRLNGAGIEDPRNKLVWRYFEYVKVLRPKIFLMENVPGILWPRHKKFLDFLYSEGLGSGYSLYPPAVIDARDYGVPQRRKRVFILGVRKDVELSLDWPPRGTHCDPKSLGENSVLQPWVPSESVFNKAVDSADINNVHMNHTPAIVEVFKRTPINGGSRKDSGRVLPCHDKHDGHTDVYGRINPKEPGPTMTTACVNPSKGRFVHPTEPHGITLRHAARFQTFPDSYIFSGGLMAGGVQVGNAVPILLGEKILRCITIALLSNMDISKYD